jgi:hypothetical protein
MSPSQGRILGGGEGGDCLLESIFNESIICEINISNFFNVDHFIMKSNYT